MSAITCGICFNILNEPLTWSCQHSFCRSCIRAQIEQGAPTGDAMSFCCPMCNYTYEGSKEKLRELYNEQLAARIAALTRGSDGAMACQWCEEAPAQIYCPDCPYVLCPECNVAVHKNSGKRHHQPVACKDPKTAKSLSKKCPIPHHEEYKLDFYCTRCEELCCAYCLQMGPHHQHENVVMAKAAHEARQRMGKDLDNLNNSKNRLENQAHEMNRICAQYQETYDSVESLIGDRFAAFHQQLSQKELEVRSQLQVLREDGDATLAAARLNYLTKLNAINEALLQYRRLQHGGADYEVLENRTMISNQLRGDVPVVSGGVFRVSDLGDLHISGLGIALDLQCLNPTTQNTQSTVASTPQQQTVAAPSNARGMSSAADASMARAAFIRLSFTPDRDVTMQEGRDGITMQCSPNASVPQIGIRAVETFDYLRQVFGDYQTLHWRIRLDNVADSKIGVVEKSTSDDPQGFYWKPMRAGQYDGEAGRPTPAIRSLPACNRGDIVTFTFDVRQLALAVAVNRNDYGVILTEVPLWFSPCFVFRPGESITLIQSA